MPKGSGLRSTAFRGSTLITRRPQTSCTAFGADCTLSGMVTHSALVRHAKDGLGESPAFCRELKDNHIFKRLSSLLEPGLTSEAAQKLAKEAVARIGSSGGHSRPLSDFSRSLCSRTFPGLLPEAHVAAALEQLVQGGTDDDVGHNLMQLVVESSAANPHLFALTAELVSRGSGLKSAVSVIGWVRGALDTQCSVCGMKGCACRR